MDQQDNELKSIEEPPVNEETPLQSGQEGSLVRSKVPLIVGGFLLLIVGLIGGYFLRKPTSQGVNPMYTITSTPPASSSKGKIDEKEFWQTYSDTDDANFNIRYPKEWSLTEKQGEAGDTSITIAGREGEVRISWGLQGVGGGCPDNQEEVTIKSGKLIVCHYSKNGQEPENYSYLFQTKTAAGALKASINEPGDQNRPIVLKILSTLEFTDKNLQAAEWETYEQKNFRFFYPSTWTIEENKTEENPPSLRFSIKKDNARISIVQAYGDSAACLYPDDDQSKQGMYVDYGTYKEYRKNSYIWRVAPIKGNPIQYTVCEKLSSGEFVGGTNIGHISLVTNDNDSSVVSEFQEIIQRIELNSQ